MKESFVEEDKKEEKMNSNDVNNLEENCDLSKDEEISEMKVDNAKGEKNRNEKEKGKKERKNTNNQKSKKKYIMLGIIISIFVIVGILISTVFALLNINNEKIISGVSISGVDVSGLSKEEAKGTIEGLYNIKKEKEIDIKYEDYETSLNPTLMEVNYDIDKAIEEAYQIGRKENIFLSNYDILFTLIGKKNINVNMSLNEELTRQTINDIGVNLPGVVVESNYSVEDDELIITKGRAGIEIEVDELIEKVKEKLNELNSNEDFIEIPVIQKEPEAIDIDKIHEEVYKEAKDAYYTKDPFVVYPEVEGVDFDVEAARELLKEDKEEYVIGLTITKPKVTLDQIGSEAFPDQLATFTTRYDVSDVDRSTNLQIACQKINGKVILVGETFSYNQALGPRTVAAGYKNGKIYSGGEVVDGLGGGICQISSTLYNAVLMANLQIVERRNHQFVTSYVAAGRDATVVYGVTDFKFKNTRQYPVRIVASARNGIATVSIYGIKEENEYTFSFSTKTISTIPYTTQYQEDASLSAGTETVKQKGANGIITETYITKMLNGKVVSTTLLSKDTYSAMTRIVIRGTKEAASQTQSNTATSTETPSTPPSTSTSEETPSNTTSTEAGTDNESVEN